MNILAHFVVFALWNLARADRNITVDDFDRRQITYNPPEQWVVACDSTTTDRYLQTTTFTYSRGASATFKFSGAHSIYYMGFGVNPDQVGTIRVIIDEQVNDVPENIDRNAPGQQILFSRTGLDVTQPHTITVRKTSPTADHGLNIDAFIYTVPDLPATTSCSCPTPTSLSSDSPPMPPIRIIGIVIGVLGGCGLLGALVFLYLHRHRYKQTNLVPPDAYPSMISPSNPPNRMSFLPPPYTNSGTAGDQPISYPRQQDNPTYSQSLPTVLHFSSERKQRPTLATPQGSQKVIANQT